MGSANGGISWHWTIYLVLKESPDTEGFFWCWKDFQIPITYVWECSTGLRFRPRTIVFVSLLGLALSILMCFDLTNSCLHLVCEPPRGCQPVLHAVVTSAAYELLRPGITSMATSSAKCLCLCLVNSKQLLTNHSKIAIEADKTSRMSCIKCNCSRTSLDSSDIS